MDEGGGGTCTRDLLQGLFVGTCSLVCFNLLACCQEDAPRYLAAFFLLTLMNAG